MVDMILFATAAALIISQFGVCFAASRCTEINTPCLSLKRHLKDDKGDTNDTNDKTNDKEKPTAKPARSESAPTKRRQGQDE